MCFIKRKTQKAEQFFSTSFPRGSNVFDAIVLLVRDARSGPELALGTGISSRQLQPRERSHLRKENRIRLNAAKLPARHVNFPPG